MVFSSTYDFRLYNINIRGGGGGCFSGRTKNHALIAYHNYFLLPLIPGYRLKYELREVCNRLIEIFSESEDHQSEEN